MSNRYYKTRITINVIKELPDQAGWTLESAMKKWWMVPRPDSGLRLTTAGDNALCTANIEHFNFNFTDVSSWSEFILNLHKKMSCPYYMGVNKVKESKKPYLRIYDSKVAMMINLYGDIHSYLDSIKVRK
jgi:hypothetical protein